MNFTTVKALTKEIPLLLQNLNQTEVGSALLLKTANFRLSLCIFGNVNFAVNFIENVLNTVNYVINTRLYIGFNNRRPSGLSSSNQVNRQTD